MCTISCSHWTFNHRRHPHLADFLVDKHFIWTPANLRLIYGVVQPTITALWSSLGAEVRRERTSFISETRAAVAAAAAAVAADIASSHTTAVVRVRNTNSVHYEFAENGMGCTCIGDDYSAYVTLLGSHSVIMSHFFSVFFNPALPSVQHCHTSEYPLRKLCHSSTTAVSLATSC